MTTAKQCAAGGTHAGQPWKCTRASQDKARHLGHVCRAHYRQWGRAGYPDAFTFAPLRTYEPGAERTELRLYVPAEMAERLRASASAKGCSVAALCRPALKRLPERLPDMTLPERLRQLLDARSLSVAKLAKATGIPASTIESWIYPLKSLGRTTEPPLARLQLVADVLCPEVERASRLSVLFEGVEATPPRACADPHDTP